MRKLRRSVAHAMMAKEGIRRVNAPRYGSGKNSGKSYFATHWKDYIPKKRKFFKRKKAK